MEGVAVMNHQAGPGRRLVEVVLRERLVANGCLAAAEAKPLDRQVEVHARDLRQDQRIPLPPIPRAR